MTVKLTVSRERRHMHIINTSGKLNIQTSATENNMHKNFLNIFFNIHGQNAARFEYKTKRYLTF